MFFRRKTTTTDTYRQDYKKMFEEPSCDSYDSPIQQQCNAPPQVMHMMPPPRRTASIEEKQSQARGLSVLQLTPLWEHIIRTNSLPRSINIDEVFDEFFERLHDPEWQVRQHALRVLVDVLIVMGQAADFHVTNLLHPLVDNLGHIAPAVRKGALDCLRVYVAQTAMPETVMLDIMNYGMGRPSKDPFNGRMSVAVILALPALILPILITPKRQYVVKAVIDALTDKMVKITYQEIALKILLKIKEMVGKLEFYELMPTNVQKDFELLCKVYGLPKSVDYQEDLHVPSSDTKKTWGAGNGHKFSVTSKPPQDAVHQQHCMQSKLNGSDGARFFGSNYDASYPFERTRLSNTLGTPKRIPSPRMQLNGSGILRASSETNLRTIDCNGNVSSSSESNISVRTKHNTVANSKTGTAVSTCIDGKHCEVEMDPKTVNGKVIMETEIKITPETAVTMRILEQNPSTQEDSSDDENVNNNKKRIITDFSTPYPVTPMKPRIYEEHNNSSGGGNHLKFPYEGPPKSGGRRVRFGGEIVKMRTPDSDAIDHSDDNEQPSMRVGGQTIKLLVDDNDNMSVNANESSTHRIKYNSNSNSNNNHEHSDNSSISSDNSHTNDYIRQANDDQSSLRNMRTSIENRRRSMTPEPSPMASYQPQSRPSTSMSMSRPVTARPPSSSHTVLEPTNETPKKKMNFTFPPTEDYNRSQSHARAKPGSSNDPLNDDTSESESQNEQDESPLPPPQPMPSVRKVESPVKPPPQQPQQRQNSMIRETKTEDCGCSRQNSLEKEEQQRKSESKIPRITLSRQASLERAEQQKKCDYRSESRCLAEETPNSIVSTELDDGAICHSSRIVHQPEVENTTARPPSSAVAYQPTQQQQKKSCPLHHHAEIPQQPKQQQQQQLLRPKTACDYSKQLTIGIPENETVLPSHFHASQFTTPNIMIKKPSPSSSVSDQETNYRQFHRPATSPNVSQRLSHFNPALGNVLSLSPTPMPFGGKNLPQTSVSPSYGLACSANGGRQDRSMLLRRSRSTMSPRDLHREVAIMHNLSRSPGTSPGRIQTSSRYDESLCEQCRSPVRSPEPMPSATQPQPRFKSWEEIGLVDSSIARDLKNGVSLSHFYIVHPTELTFPLIERKKTAQSAETFLVKSIFLCQVCSPLFSLRRPHPKNPSERTENHDDVEKM